MISGRIKLLWTRASCCVQRSRRRGKAKEKQRDKHEKEKDACTKLTQEPKPALCCRTALGIAVGVRST